MTTKKTTVLLLLVVAMAVIGLTVTAGGSLPQALLAKLPGHGGLAHGPHGGGHHGQGGHGAFTDHMHQAIGQLIDELALDEHQQARIETLHETMAGHVDGVTHVHDAHLANMIEQLEAGNLLTPQVRSMVDHHIEELRQVAYQVGEQVTGLVDSLDASQRDRLLAHLRAVRAHHDEHRARHETGDD